MRIDFTLFLYKEFIQSVLQCGYSFCFFEDFFGRSNNKNRLIILRHDVDKKPENAIQMAKIEHDLGVEASYYFRVIGKSFNEVIIKEIADLGHEIGYHYENLSEVSRNMKDERKKNEEGFEKELFILAIYDFERNLEKLRKFYPVKTICMHGSPLSKYDNRDLWKKYDYRDYGIIGEPYFDINFNEVFYLTDTGRRWDGKNVSVRDKIDQNICRSNNKCLKFRSTQNIIDAIKNDVFPDKVMLTIHPQRWTNNPVLWMKELVWQNVKNIGKRVIVANGGKN